jgi:Ferritin-like domain
MARPGRLATRRNGLRRKGGECDSGEDPVRHGGRSSAFAGRIVRGHVFVQIPATTPPTAPEQPTGADTELLAALQGLELAARDLYQTALDAGASDEDDVLETLRTNHEGYANVISGLIGGAAPQQRDEALFAQFQADFDTSDLGAIAAAAYDFESSAVATYLDALNQLEGTDGAKTVASIVIVESRHCAVLADLGGQGDDLDALLVNDAAPFELAGSTS